MKQPHGSEAGRDHAAHRRHAERERAPARPARSAGARRILVVDDSLVSRELMKVYLIARDVELLEAADGFEAVDRVRSHRPDLVLADLRMPHLDGFGLCAALRADPALASIPVVILTSSCDLTTEARLRAAGAREVLRKPIQPQPLIEAVHRHLPMRAPARPREERRAAGAEPVTGAPGLATP
jgi:CheY-like chemotaxis protein